MPHVSTGLDLLLRCRSPVAGAGRVGLLCNATTVTSDWLPTAEAVHQLRGLRLERILSPQHGFAAEKQDNMIESADGTHPRLGVPTVSLYAARREPDTAMLGGLDALLIDLQDVGTRVYTFLVTALLTMRAAAACGLPVVVLDRPNPIAGEIEGPILEDRFQSFVGQIDVPLRHGLTAGEYCLYGAWRLGLIDEAAARRAAECARRMAESGTCPGTVADGWLRIVPLLGWRRSFHYDDTGLPWTMPSPNMPSPATALVYPGQVILEGTSLSEGRGATRPFELFGAPSLDRAALLATLREAGWITAAGDGCDRALARGVTGGPLAGSLLREVAFEPTFHKYAGQLVQGFQLHVLDRAQLRPVALTTALLWALRRRQPDVFTWREPPYEYTWDRTPVDLIYGTDRPRRGIDSGTPLAEILRGWTGAVAAYKQRVGPFLLYKP